MSNKYQQSKIYKLTSIHTDEIYVGSTSLLYLGKRLYCHKYKYKNKIEKNLSSFKLFKLGAVKIKLIENYPCNSKEELIMREQYWLETLPNCLNTKNAYTSIEDKKAQKQIKNKENLSVKIKCICGVTTSKHNIARHEKSLLHQVHVLLEDFTTNKIYK